MESNQILQDLRSLPLDLQKEAEDFIAFLKTQVKKTKPKPKLDLMKEPFIGMWRGRADMKDSVAWISDLRKKQWSQK